MAETSIAADIFSDTSTHGVIVADGYGVQITVRSGHLVIQDGLGRTRRTRRIPRIPKITDRLVILSSAGMITTEAIRWLADAGIPWAHLTSNSQVIATSGPQTQDARLIRAQSRAHTDGDLAGVGLEITRYLIMHKIQGQLENISEFFSLPDVELDLKDRLADLEQAESIEAIGGVEGQAASIYWQAWANRVHVPFSPTDCLKIPANWLSFTQRHSLAHPFERNKDATDPINATLSYLYRIGEVEAVHACHLLGLLPNLGINHLDKAGRDSMALDLLEAIRPACDRIALRIFDTGLGIPYDARTGKPQYFNQRWLHETREGTVRLCPPYTHQLASHAAELSKMLMPHAHYVAKQLASAANGQVTIRQLAKSEKPATKEPRYYPRIHLRPGVKAADVIPDNLWDEITPILTERKPSRRGRKPEPPTRELVAAMVLRYVLRVPWHQVGMKQDTVEVWLAAWSDESCAPVPSVWARVRAIVEATNHLSTLTV
jgi:CRISPR-associated endonuclease Cas1